MVSRLVEVASATAGTIQRSVGSPRVSNGYVPSVTVRLLTHPQAKRRRRFAVPVHSKALTALAAGAYKLT